MSRIQRSAVDAPEKTPPLSPESTQLLLARARAGDEAALNRLLDRSVVALQRWAHGRLPPFARQTHDTVDVVQDAVIKALRNLDDFEPRHEGALLAYLRKAVSHRIVDLVKRAASRPKASELNDTIPDDGTSPLDAAIGAQNRHRYEAALDRLRDDDRAAIMLRLELQYSYEELAVALGKSSAGAARVTVRRALQRLAAEMAQGTERPKSDRS